MYASTETGHDAGQGSAQVRGQRESWDSTGKTKVLQRSSSQASVTAL